MKSKRTTKIIALPFVTHEIPALETLKDSYVYQLREKLNKGEKMNREEKNWLARAIRDSSYFKNGVALLGYRFDFKDVLKTFLVKQYDSWKEYKAPDKTSLRNALYGRIEKIVELSN